MKKIKPERGEVCACVYIMHVAQGRSWFTGCTPLDKKILCMQMKETMSALGNTS